MKYSDYSQSLERATQARERGDTWDDQQFRDARERDLRQRTADVRSAVIGVLSCLLLAALLTSGKIVEIAERQDFGPARDRQLALAEGLDRVANFLSLNRPYDAIHELRGAGESAAARIDTIDEVAADRGIDTPATVSTPPVTSSAPTEPAGGAPATTSTTTSTTTVPTRFPLRTVAADAPLRVFVGGDSQAEYLGQAITTESGLALDVIVDHRIATSLARPDYFNWPARLAEVGDDVDPEAVVLFIGANDYLDMQQDGEYLVRGSDEWRAEWARRAAITFDLLEAAHRQVFWVTQPPMRDGVLDEGSRVINEITAPLIAERDFVTAIDIHDLFGGSDGFADQVVGPDGTTIRARNDDGVHLTRSASSWVADLVFTAMQQTWDFTSAPAG